MCWRNAEEVSKPLTSPYIQLFVLNPEQYEELNIGASKRLSLYKPLAEGDDTANLLRIASTYLPKAGNINLMNDIILLWQEARRDTVRIAQLTSLNWRARRRGKS